MSRAPDGLTMSLCTPRTNMESEGIPPLILNFGTMSQIKEKTRGPAGNQPPFLSSSNVQPLFTNTDSLAPQIIHTDHRSYIRSDMDRMWYCSSEL